MIKLLRKYLKPYWLALIFAIVLLFVQAFANLGLPSIMSDIVNVGIQQGGITSPTPTALSENGLTFIKTFMTPEEQNLVDASYTLYSPTDKSTQEQDYANTYPLLATESIYVENSNVSSADQQTLDTAFGTATWTMIYSLQALQAEKAAAAGQPAPADQSSASLSGQDITKLYSLQPVMAAQPALISDSRTKSEALDPFIISQSGTVLVKQFDIELGLDVGAIQNTYILYSGIKMLIYTLIGGIAAILVVLISSIVGAGVSRNIRKDLFERVTSFSSKEFDEFTTSSLITRTTNDITQIQLMLTMGIRLLVYAPILAIGGIIMALRSSTSMAWVIAVSLIVLFCVMGTVLVLALPRFKIQQKLIDRLNLVARENLNGMTVIRAFGTEKFEKNRFKVANEDLSNVQLFINRIMVILMPMMMFIMNTTCLLIIWVGSHQVVNGNMQIGDMMAFMQYAIQIIIAFLILSFMFILIPRAQVSSVRIYNVLQTESSIKEPVNPVHFKEALPGEKPGVIKFDHVTFSYGGDEDAITDISFTALPGQTTAFIGATGSGKSSLINLIPRFYDVTSGTITIDGINVQDVPEHELRSRIGFVPQKGILMSGTIASNIRYGDQNATDEEVHKAAEIAQAIPFITDKPEGFDSPIAAGGTNVSGGQKQRLAIARALAKKAEINIFDDSFSALDFKTDITLRKALKEDTADSTVLIVAQRVSTIMGAEQIIVLDQGKVVGMGTHQELLKTCPTYYEIASSQLSKEELENE